MANIQTTKSINPFFLEAAGEYLEANGYKRSDGELVNNAIYFFDGKQAVVVYNDHVDFMTYDNGEPGQRREGYSKYMSFAGIADLDIFKWMLLLHVADIVPLKQFVKEVRKESPTDVVGFVNQMLGHFRVAEDRNAVPINY